VPDDEHFNQKILLLCVFQAEKYKSEADGLLINADLNCIGTFISGLFSDQR